MDGRPTSFKPAVTATLHAPHSRLTARKWVHLWVFHGRASKRRAPTRSPTRGCRGEKLCRESRWWVAGDRGVTSVATPQCEKTSARASGCAVGVYP